MGIKVYLKGSKDWWICQDFSNHSTGSGGSVKLNAMLSIFSDKEGRVDRKAKGPITNFSFLETLLM